MSCASLQLNSRCWLRLRTPSRLASRGLWAPQDLVALQPPLKLALRLLLWPPQRPRCRRPVIRLLRPCCARQPSRLPPLGLAPAPGLQRRCPSVHRVHRVAAPAPLLACVERSLWRPRDWSRAWLPSVAHQSLLPSCASPASLALSTPPQLAHRHLQKSPRPLHPRRRPPSPPVLRRPRPTPMTTGTLSSTLTASPRLWVAPRPPKPSRPTPLVLVGGLATSVAVANARLPSAPCGGKFDRTLLPSACSRLAWQLVAAVMGLFSAGFARLFSGVCCAFSCRLCAARVCPCWLLAVARQSSLSLSPRVRSRL